MKPLATTKATKNKTEIPPVMFLSLKHNKEKLTVLKTVIKSAININKLINIKNLHFAAIHRHK